MDSCLSTDGQEELAFELWFDIRRDIRENLEWNCLISEE